MEITLLLSTDDRAVLRRWLMKNHRQRRECWVASYRGKQALPYLDVVEEALCFGWIDSTVKKMPDGRLAQRISPGPQASRLHNNRSGPQLSLRAAGILPAPPFAYVATPSQPRSPAPHKSPSPAIAPSPSLYMPTASSRQA